MQPHGAQQIQRQVIARLQESQRDRGCLQHILIWLRDGHPNQTAADAQAAVLLKPRVIEQNAVIKKHRMAGTDR